MSALEGGVVGFFDVASVPPPGGSTEFSLHLWDSTRSRGLAPTFNGNYSDDPALRREFLVGARMLGYELVDLDDLELIASMKAESPPRFPLQPQQLELADALNAPGYDEYVVEIMRRAAKTTTIFCWCLGRCHERPGYQVTFSAQSGVKGSSRLREWKNRLDRTCPDPEAGLPPWRRGLTSKTKAVQRQIALFGDELIEEAEEATGRGFRILMGEVGKGIYFDNGSQFLVFKPDADAYRGEGGDVSWVDEAQELDPDEGADLFAGIVPLQDTKDDPALVVSGTAGEARVGPFWERVNRLRNGDPDIGGVDYCAPEDTPWKEVVEVEEEAIALLKKLHPGIGTLTTEEKMRKNWRKFDKPKWAREYLSLWPETAGATVIDKIKWEAGRLKRFPERPTLVAFGEDIKPGGSVAAVAAAWRNKSGVAYIEIVDHRPGTIWLPTRAQQLSRTYRRSTMAYDDIAEGKATATEMQRLTPKPRVRVQTYSETAAGCVQILRDITRGTIRFPTHAGLDNAVEHASKRQVRGDNRGLWLWTPDADGVDITTLVAATRALRNWDQWFARKTGDEETGIVAAS